MWLIITLFLVGLMAISLYPNTDLVMVLLISYIVAMIMFVVYEGILLKELYLEDKKDWFSIHNSWFQLYIGAVSLLAAALTFAISAIARMDVEVSLMLFVGLNLLLILGSFSYTERVINQHTKYGRS